MYAYSTPIRHRACIAYIPWIATLFFALFVAGLGVWVHYTLSALHDVRQGLDTITVDWDATELPRIRQALVATAITQFVLVIIALCLSMWREIVHMQHDRRGFPAPSSGVLLVFNALFNSLWWLLTVWLVLLVAADFIWILMVFLAREQATAAITAQDTYGPALFLPGTVCPGQCLDLSNYAWMSKQTFQNACICDRNQIETASTHFNDAYSPLYAVLVGVWVLYLSAQLLFANLACQFALTRKEREVMPSSPLQQAVAMEYGNGYSGNGNGYNPNQMAARPAMAV